MQSRFIHPTAFGPEPVRTNPSIAVARNSARDLLRLALQAERDNKLEEFRAYASAWIAVQAGLSGRGNAVVFAQKQIKRIATAEIEQIRPIMNKFHNL